MLILHHLHLYLHLQLSPAILYYRIQNHHPKLHRFPNVKFPRFCRYQTFKMLSQFFHHPRTRFYQYLPLRILIQSYITCVIYQLTIILINYSHNSCDFLFSIRLAHYFRKSDNQFFLTQEPIVIQIQCLKSLHYRGFLLIGGEIIDHKNPSCFLEFANSLKCSNIVQHFIQIRNFNLCLMFLNPRICECICCATSFGRISQHFNIFYLTNILVINYFASLETDFHSSVSKLYFPSLTLAMII
ncbi:hypothetical protein FGO68_gene9788 [Halteria grandinella]|uniref:Uncharacterized protein n=1 Tax=Halteria grandinella TaxID=5974 RepID=A0A8J8SWM9_HALGN|nr:hypothetical protein FGO68_gene9788 [Halteria grandinella]